MLSVLSTHSTIKMDDAEYAVSGNTLDNLDGDAECAVSGDTLNNLDG